MNLKDIMEVESMIEWLLDMAYNDVENAKTELVMCNVESIHISSSIDILYNAIFKLSHIRELTRIVLDAIDEHVKSSEPERYQKEDM